MAQFRHPAANGSREYCRRFGVVQHPVGTRECLNQPVVFQVFVHVQGVQVFAVETSEQHIHHYRYINLVWRIIFVAIFLVFDTALYILIIQIELVDAVVGSVLQIEVGNNFH